MQYMAAADTHLGRLERVQRTAQRICGCSFQSLKGRREAAVFSLICKLLDGECVSHLQKFCLVLTTSATNRTSRHNVQGLHLESVLHTHRHHSLDTYKRSWVGQASNIFASLPQSLVMLGARTKWSQIKDYGKSHLNGKRIWNR